MADNDQLINTPLPDYAEPTPLVEKQVQICTITRDLKAMESKLKANLTRISKAMDEYKGLASELSNLQTFRDNRTDLIDAALSKTLKCAMRDELLEGAVQNADLRAVAGLYDKLYNSSRLERNLSTTNNSVQVSFTAVDLKKSQAESE